MGFGDIFSTEKRTTNTQQTNYDTDTATATGGSNIVGGDLTVTDGGLVSAGISAGLDIAAGAAVLVDGVVRDALDSNAAAVDAVRSVSRDALDSNRSAADTAADTVRSVSRDSLDSNRAAIDGFMTAGAGMVRAIESAAASASAAGMQANRELADNSRLTVAAVSDLADSALYRQSGLAETSMLNMADLAGLSMDNSFSLARELVGQSINTTVGATRDALDFAASSVRSDSAMNSDTLIKWGAGVVGAVAIALITRGLK